MSRLSSETLAHCIETPRGDESFNQRNSRHSFDLVVAFSILGVALVSTVALIGDMAYTLPRTVSVVLGVLPLLAVALVGFAVFARRRK